MSIAPELRALGTAIRTGRCRGCGVGVVLV